MFNEVPPLERLAAAAAAGFPAVEMQFPYPINLAELAAARAAAGVEFVLINMPAGNFAAGERGIACLPDRRHAFAEGLQLAIEYASALGCRRLNCLAGNLPDLDAQTACWNTLGENLATAADALAAHGMELLLEPLNRADNPAFILGSIAAADRLVASLGKGNIKLQYDTYHVRAADENWLAILAAFIGRIGHIQFSDFPGRGEPGTGELDLKRFFTRLRSLPYQGWVGAEYTPSTRTGESLAWLPATASDP